MSSERPPYQLHPVTVKRSLLVAPHMKRITIDGRCLSTLRPELPAQWFKLFVPLKGGQRSSGRAYTVRRFDRTTHELDIDLFLHGDSGPVSAWAESAQVGDMSRSAMCIRAAASPSSGARRTPFCSATKRPCPLNLINRRRDDQDKRVNLIFLSETEISLAHDIRHISSGVQDEALAGVSQEELDVAISVLSRMKDNLERTTGGGDQSGRIGALV